MRILFTLLIGVVVCSTVVAQGVITRIGSDGTKFYYNGVADLQGVFDDAATLSPNFRDTILFSGGTFNLELLPGGATTLSISSPVIIVGTGILADSSAAYGGPTIFTGNARSLVLRSDADGTEMHGLTFNMSGVSDGVVRLGVDAADSDVDNVKFYRCSIASLTLNHTWSGNSLANDILIEHCVIRDRLRVQSATGVQVRNSFLWRGIDVANSNTNVKNCIMLNYGADLEQYSTSVGYESTIFLTNGSSLTVGGSAIYTNCLFVGNDAAFAQNLTFNPGVTQTGTQTAPSLAEAFPGVPSPAGYTIYQFAGDYTLALPYLGTDGTPLGVYGGDAPWKDGSLPFNPHWSLLTTNANTTNGVLQGVHIKASAQEN